MTRDSLEIGTAEDSESHWAILMFAAIAVTTMDVGAILGIFDLSSVMVLATLASTLIILAGGVLFTFTRFSHTRLGAIE